MAIVTRTLKQGVKKNTSGSEKPGPPVMLAITRKTHKPIKKVSEPDVFVKACEKAGIPATRRQLAKWNRKSGLAFARRNA